MENSFQTSFIPKKPITSSETSKAPRSLLSLVSTFLIIILILITGGLFGYKIYLAKQKEALSVSLAQARDSFEKETIDELSLFDKRTEVAKKVLGDHLVFSPMFSLLGEMTIPSVQYTDFEQQTNKGTYSVKIEGLARDYRSIALQADAFNTPKGRSFKNVLFSNLIKDKNNNITFDLEFDVDPNLLSYEKNSLLEQNNEVVQPDNSLLPDAPLEQDLSANPQ
jgi:hypothetical protein